MEPHTAPPTLIDPQILHGERIVCFAGEDWWYHNPHSNKHLMQALARNGNKVLFGNSTGGRAPNLFGDRFAWKRVAGKLISMLTFLGRAEPRLHVLTPIALPVTRRLRRFVLFVNQLLIAAQVRSCCALLGISRPIVWIATPAAASAAMGLRRKWAKLLVYYCVDNISFYSGADTPFIQQLDAHLQSRADLILFSGRRLFEERVHQRPDIYLLPHGVDFDHFARAQAPGGTLPDDLRALSQPIVAFIGAITGLDVQLIEYVARRQPRVSFVFIGKVQMDVSRLTSLANVHFLGKKDYEVLPDYLRCFRCCLICYRRGDTFNEYRSPKKLYEYLASGRPLVSVQLAELDAFATLVYQAGNAEEFDAQLERALAEDDPELCRLRVEIARARDWRVVAAEASQHISRYLRGGRDKVAAADQALQSSS
jgi:glycosyltransferase involved in cell wall biosynthesis